MRAISTGLLLASLLLLFTGCHAANEADTTDPVYPIYCLMCDGDCKLPSAQVHHGIIEWHKEGVPHPQHAEFWFDWCDECQDYTPHWPCTD